MGHMVTTLDGVVTITETITCCHHNTVHEIPHGADRYWCTKCWLPQCVLCENSGICTPFEKKLDAFEKGVKIALDREYSRAQFLRAVGVL